MGEKNWAVYASAGMVDYYSRINLLQPAEKTILELLRDRLPTMDMLDIGIGGGRTTQHFLPLVGSYTGIDYAAGMVTACRRRFSQASPSIHLAVVDARDMGLFADNSFDFILFSFNGIDYVSHGDRIRILQEIHRVGKPGCCVLFSSHNLQHIAGTFDYRHHLSRNPLKAYENLAMWGVLRLFNRSVSRAHIGAANYLVLRDESHNFRLQTYYIRPQEQVKQLAFGFGRIEIYSWQRGTRLGAADDEAAESDAWLYYFCVVNDRPKIYDQPPVALAFAKPG
ncbi:class I SAM-dependent methyltransferase [Nodosilinea nodulosa]|uniref:class I SAM-dependent methyltransferase n=1 Tax=Nodosilinea nodulosa TaxID=416001 RepID=UPI0002F30AE3|nr:class I SAM-dependent methyltransferase [Nodosilinea nodulosa]